MNIGFTRLFLAFVLAFGAHAALFSQEEQPENPWVPAGKSAEMEMKVFQFRHSSAKEIVVAIDSVFANSGAKYAVNARSNTLSVFASQKSLKQIESLIKNLDIENPDDTPITAVQTIGKHELTQIADVAKQLVSSPGNVKVVADHLTGTLILQGNKSEVHEIKELLGEIVAKAAHGASDTTDEKNLAVKVTWLADLDSFNFEPAPLLGKLVGVAAELKKQGMLNDAGVLTSVYSTLRSGTQFQKNKFSIASKKGEVAMHVDGVLGEEMDCKLDLSISMVLRHGQTEIPLSTMVRVPLNHPIAFAVSDVGEIKSAAVVEVVEVDP